MNKYLVALQTGGLMEDPVISYCDYQVVEAESSKEAAALYNKKNKCSFFYGTCMAGIENGAVQVFNKALSFQKLEDFSNATS